MKKIMFNDKYCLTQAVVDGKKTQTRRILSKRLLASQWDVEDCTIVVEDKNGEFIDARKTNFCQYKMHEIVAVAQSYESIIGKYGIPNKGAGYTNKMFVKADLMPHQIRITGIRVERLQDISDEDCMKEGIYKGKCGNKDHWMDAYYVPNINEAYCTPKIAFEELIDKVSGKGTWDSNAWVWVYDFELVK